MREARYVTTTGELIANNWADLTDGELIAPVNITADGSANNNALVWTGTTPAGEGVGNGFYCNDPCGLFAHALLARNYG